MYLPIPHRQPFGKQTHCYWDDFLSEDELNYLNDHPVWDSASTAKVGMMDSSIEGVIDTKIRNSNVAWLDIDQDNFVIFNKIAGVISEVNRRYFHLNIDACYEPAQMTGYSASANGHYDWHIDYGVGDATVPRKLSMSLLLNEPGEFIGGDLQFMFSSDKVESVTQKRGRAWFFPSNVLHRVSPVVSGVRKSLVLWIGGPDFK